MTVACQQPIILRAVQSAEKFITKCRSYSLK